MRYDPCMKHDWKPADAHTEPKPVSPKLLDSVLGVMLSPKTLIALGMPRMAAFVDASLKRAANAKRVEIELQDYIAWRLWAFSRDMTSCPMPTAEDRDAVHAEARAIIAAVRAT